MQLLAYLITWTTYATWLRGDRRGSVINENRVGYKLDPPSSAMRAFDRALLTSHPIRLDREARAIVAQTIRDDCRHRGWTLRAINARSNHVHVVVSGNETPEQMMLRFKAWSTRALRAARSVGEGPVWTRHGSTRYLTTETSVAAAIEYVTSRQ